MECMNFLRPWFSWCGGFLMCSQGDTKLVLLMIWLLQCIYTMQKVSSLVYYYSEHLPVVLQMHSLGKYLILCVFIGCITMHSLIHYKWKTALIAKLWGPNTNLRLPVSLAKPKSFFANFLFLRKFYGENK